MPVSLSLHVTMALDVAPDVTLAIGGVLGVAVLAGFAAVAGVVLLVIKRSLVNSCPVGLSFHSTDPDAYPSIDRLSLESYSRSLERLGFAALADYSISAEMGTVQPGFARLFGHPERRCYAEINQLFPTSQTVPMRVVLTTRLTDGWSAMTTDRVADAGVWLLRRPRSCWRSMPDAPVESMFERHLELVRMIEAGTGARNEPRCSAESWYDDERRNAVTVRETLARRSIVVMLWEFFSYRGRTEWLGSLKPARSNARNDYN